MMKIVHICLGSPYYLGYSYQENLLAKHHSLMGASVTIIATRHGFKQTGEPLYINENIQHENGCKILRINDNRFPSIKLNLFIRRFKGLYKLLTQEAPDIIFSHSVSYWDSIQVAKYAKNHPSVKLFIDNHADYKNSARNFASKYIKHKLIWGRRARLLAKYAIKCFGVTPIRCDFLSDIYGIPKNKISYLPLGVDDANIPTNIPILRASICRILNIPADSFIVTTGGKIDMKKNVHHLLAAIDKINNPMVHLIVFGNIKPDAQEYLSHYKNNQNIHFVGWSNAEQVNEYLSISDLCCFPGTHSTIWEQTVGLGIPTIFKDWGANMHYLNINGNCIFVNGENERELANTIKLLMETDQYEKMKTNAQEASKYFRYSEIAKKSIGLS